MAESNKEIHIVFQVLNFIFTSVSDGLKLLPIDKLFLLALAKHHGARGIYPSIPTLAQELSITDTYVKQIIRRMEKAGMIGVDRSLGTRNHYYLLFLSTDQSTTVNRSTTVNQSTVVTPTSQLQFQNQVTTVTPINTDNQFIERKQRARKARAALPDSFLPIERLNPLWQETAVKSGKNKDQLLMKFKNLQKSKDGMSADWNAEFENFLLNERPMGYVGGKQTPELKNTIAEYGKPGHPDYERNKEFEKRYAEEMKKKNELMEAPLPVNILTNEEFVAKVREYKQKKLNGQSQHGELTNGTTSIVNTRNNSG